MQYELTIASERDRQIILSFHDDYPDDMGSINLGFKEFKGVGSFNYGWLLEWIDLDEARSLVECLQFAIEKVSAVNDAAASDDEPSAS